MDWLDNLGKDNKMDIYEKTVKRRRRIPRAKKTENVKEYKAQYYLNNIEIYTERNREASRQRTIERINKLSDDNMMYKMNYILDN